MTFPSPPHRHVSECASTNDLARAWIRDEVSPAPHGAYVWADFQMAGRGRRGRTWTAAPGESVLVSVVLRPAFPQSEAWTLAFAAGLAVSDVLLEQGIFSRLKWPNDVLLDGKKAAGILVETVPTPAGWAAIVGVGVNVHQSAFPEDAGFAVPPTSLFLETGRAFDIPALTAAVAAHGSIRAEQARAAVLDTWRERMATGITLRRGTETGLFSHVDDEGAARVLLPNGTYARWTTVDGPETNPVSVEYNNANASPSPKL